MGGQNGRTGGFYGNAEKAREAGRKGGTISRRGAGSTTQLKIIPQAERIKNLYRRGLSVPQIAKELDIPYSTLLNWVKKEIPEYGVDEEA